MKQWIRENPLIRLSKERFTEFGDLYNNYVHLSDEIGKREVSTREKFGRWLPHVLASLDRTHKVTQPHIRTKQGRAVAGVILKTAPSVSCSWLSLEE